MRILIIRHGEPDYSIDSLTEKGWREAELLSRRLADMKIDAFYCSPLGRARDTAKPTMERLGRDVTILPWLEEFAGRIIDPCCGDERIPWDLYPQYWTAQPELFDREKWLDNGLYRTGSVRQIYERTIRGVDELLEEYGFRREGMIFKCEKNEDKTIALFCHFAMGQTIIAHLTGLPAPVLWHATMLPASSVTTLISEERRPGDVFFRVFQMGDTSHLYIADEPLSSSGLYEEIADRR